jgi:hypothetical protein
MSDRGRNVPPALTHVEGASVGISLELSADRLLDGDD